MQVNSITKAELEVAWPILQPAGGYSLSRPETEALLRRFCGGQGQLDTASLRRLAGPTGTSADKLETLFTQDCRGCDPDAAALALLDPGHTGGVDLRLIGRLMEELTGLTAVCEADLAAVLALADTDGDGKVGLEDLHRLSATFTRPGQGHGR